jgi:hypothetical protein
MTGDVVKGGLILFELGNDELTEDAKTGLRALLPTLSGSPYKITLKGHAGPTEVGRIYKQDIDLAYARAVRVRDYLVSFGLQKEFFEISVVDSSSLPHPAVLLPGMDPNLAGASVEVMLMDQTLRVTRENQEQWTTETPL